MWISLSHSRSLSDGPVFLPRSLRVVLESATFNASLFGICAEAAATLRPDTKASSRIRHCRIVYGQVARRMPAARAEKMLLNLIEVSGLSFFKWNTRSGVAVE